jgi:hypothetical protein
MACCTNPQHTPVTPTAPSLVIQEPSHGAQGRFVVGFDLGRTSGSLTIPAAATGSNKRVGVSETVWADDGMDLLWNLIARPKMEVRRT